MVGHAEAIRIQRTERRAASDTRLAAVVEYVAARLESTADGSRGAVKLNKVIWWADQESFRRLGFSITGGDYQRLPQGPVPYRLPPVRDDLQSAKRVKVVQRDVGHSNLETVLEPGPKSDLTEVRKVLSIEDIELLDESLEKFFAWTGKRVSEFSHTESLAWQTFDDGELIPDAAWLLDPEPVDISDVDVQKLLTDNNLTA